MATSLEKSHSKSSNAKLTLICFLLSLTFAGVWLGLLLIFQFNLMVVGIITSAASLLLLFLFLHIIGKFTR